MDDSIRIIRLSDDYNFKSFDCGNDDLNDFFVVECEGLCQKTFICDLHFRGG